MITLESKNGLQTHAEIQFQFLGGQRHVWNDTNEAWALIQDATCCSFGNFPGIPSSSVLEWPILWPSAPRDRYADVLSKRPATGPLGRSPAGFPVIHGPSQTRCGRWFVDAMQQKDGGKGQATVGDGVTGDHVDMVLMLPCAAVHGSLGASSWCLLARWERPYKLSGPRWRRTVFGSIHGLKRTGMVYKVPARCGDPTSAE